MTAPDPRVGEIQARLAAATPGPWRLSNPRPDGRNMVERPGYDLYGGEVSEMVIVDTNPSDAAFIANAPADVAYLLGLLRERDEALARVESCVSALDNAVTVAEYKRATEDLRAAVAAANGDKRG